MDFNFKKNFEVLKRLRFDWMINVYGPYPNHLPIEEYAVQNSTWILSNEQKICLKTQLDHLDRFAIQGKVPDDWYQIRIYSQLELVNSELRPLEGWIRSEDLSESFLKSSGSSTKFSEQSFRDLAQKYIGRPYRWGGKSFLETDCSGLTYQIYREKGKILPRYADGQFQICEQISPSELKSGDLIFGVFTKDVFKPVHVMMYLGDDLILESSGLPEIYKTHLTRVQEKWNRSLSEISPGWSPQPDYQIYFGRPIDKSS